jgi:hypothetical protein
MVQLLFIASTNSLFQLLYAVHTIYLTVTSCSCRPGFDRLNQAVRTVALMDVQDPVETRNQVGVRS